MRLALANIYTRGAVPPPPMALQMTQQHSIKRLNTFGNGNSQMSNKCSIAGREFVVVNVNEEQRKKSESQKKADDLFEEADDEKRNVSEEKDYAEFQFKVPPNNENNNIVGVALGGAKAAVKGSMATEVISDDSSNNIVEPLLMGIILSDKKTSIINKPSQI